MISRRLSLLVAVLGLAFASGCLVRTTPGHHRQHARHGSDHHCHERGGKHKKRVCHAHPHDAGHH